MTDEGRKHKDVMLYPTYIHKICLYHTLTSKQKSFRLENYMHVDRCLLASSCLTTSLTIKDFSEKTKNKLTKITPAIYYT